MQGSRGDSFIKVQRHARSFDDGAQKNHRTTQKKQKPIQFKQERHRNKD